MLAFATIAMRLTAHTRRRRLVRLQSVVGGLISTLSSGGACVGLCVLLLIAGHAVGQMSPSPERGTPERGTPEVHRARSARFLGGRTPVGGRSSAAALAEARRQQLALIAAQANATSSLNAAWQAVGPNQIASASYGAVTGRVTAIAVDPSDGTGNTVYLGTTGGGVWKSTNAAGASGGVTFQPLTDTLPVFNANAGTASIPSLSIGAVSVQAARNGVVLAGTGDPNDAADSYYGSGLLRSADGGATWTLIPYSNDVVSGVTIHHSFVGLGVAGFAWSDQTPGLVVVAISDALEGDLVNAPDPDYSVRGLYYSIDAGATWQMSVVMDGAATVQAPQVAGSNVGGNAATAVVWNPVRQRFYAAMRYHGYYESADGVTWTRLPQQPATSLTTGACPTNPGATGNASCPIFRGALAVQPVSGDTFALTVDSGNLDQGLWQDVCASAGSSCAGAVSFSKRLVSTPLEVGSGSTVIAQADYNLALSAMASGVGTANPDTLLFVGTTDLYRCTLSAGCSLRNTTNARNGCAAPAGVAGAQHAIATLGAASQALLYVANDGGLWRSTDGVNQQATPCSSDDASHFQNLNGGLGSLAEIFSFAEHPKDANTLLAGVGANGSAGTAAAGSTSLWGQLAAGEGGTVAIDPAYPLNWYISTTAGVSIRQCSSGAACTTASFAGPPTIGLPQVSNDASLIDPPWLLDPVLPEEIVIGTCRVWRGPAANGTSWSAGNAISKLLAGPQNSACSSTMNPLLRSLAAGGPASNATAAQDAGSTVLYAGMAGELDGGGSAGGHVYRTLAGGVAGPMTVWTDVTGSPVTNGGGQFNPDGYDISSLAADAHDATGETVYATVMGFGVGHIYRSVDAGAHWTNISSNLPDAPASSVVVDPNDANTLYIALDTGVYVTNAVATCTSTNCWSIYGVGLPNAPIVQLAVAAGMATGDGRSGELRAGTYGRGIWQIPLLTATSAAQPAMSLNPTALTFGAQSVGTASGGQTITVTNTGTAPLTVSSISVTGDFNETDTCTGAPVAVGGNCAVTVVFLPTATGTRSGVLTVFGNVAGGQATATLTGTATASTSIVLTPIALVFPTTVVGATAVAQNITISNLGGTTATLGTPVVSGDFKLSANTCGLTLAASTGCTVAITFSPTVSGTRAGTLTVTDSVGTQTASLRGAATSPATDTLTPASLVFAKQQVDTVSLTQQVTLTNAGDVALTLIVAAVTSGDFIAVNACGNSLNAHSTCSIAVSYVPKNVGSETGVLTVSDQFRSQTVALSGFGLAPPGVSLAPFATVNFAALGVGIVSAGQTVTLTNNGGVPLAITGFAVAGDFVILPGSNACGSSLAVSAACTLQVAFAPTAAAARSGSLTVTDGAASSPQVLGLTGTGVDFTLVAGNSSASVASGQSAVYPVLLTSVSGVPGNAVFTCSGGPAYTTCMVVPGTVALGTGTVLATVTVATGVASAALLPGVDVLWVALLLPLWLGFAGAGRRRSPLRRWASLLVLCGVMVATSCGSAPRTIPGGPTTATPTVPTPTPSGTSTIVVSAASAGLVRTVDLSLTVQ